MWMILLFLRNLLTLVRFLVDCCSTIMKEQIGYTVYVIVINRFSHR